MDQNELSYLGWILDQNKDKDFVQRILNPKASPTITLPTGEVATHKLAVEQQGGKYFVFPTLQRDPSGRGLVDKGKNAFFDAMQSGDVVQFNTPGDAEWFSKNFNKGWETK